MEKIFIIPLRDAWKISFRKRSKKAITVIKEFTVKNMKADSVKIGQDLNKLIWQRGEKSPPRQVKVQMHTEENDGKKTVWVELADVKFAIPKKKDKTEKKEETKQAKKAGKPEEKEPAKDEKEEKAKEEMKKSSAENKKEAKNESKKVKSQEKQKISS